MLNKKLTLLVAFVLIAGVPTLATAGADFGADIANDHLLYFASPGEMVSDSARSASPEDFADLYNDHQLYFVPETPESEWSWDKSFGNVDYSDPEEWALTPDNYL